MKGLIIYSLLLCSVFLSGCATVYSGWGTANIQNTRDGYEKFIQAYPNSEFTAEAKKRAEDPEYAFLATCTMGTPQTIAGYVSSYPSSRFVPLFNDYVEFIKETKSKDIKSYKQFIAQHPNSSFVTEAKIATPLLWLKEKGQKVGVIINVGKVIFKGVLGGGVEKAEKTRERVYKKIKSELENENVKSALFDNLETVKTSNEKVELAVMVNYSESEYPQSSAPIAYRPYESPLANAASWSAAGAVSALIYNPAHETTIIDVKGVNDGVDYYTGFSGVSSSKGKSINRKEVLKAINEDFKLANAIASLKGKDLSNSDVRKNVDDLLKQINSYVVTE